jgi:hypothetical protein
VVALGELVYAIGVHDGYQELKTVQHYICKMNEWCLITSMSMERSNTTMRVLNGKENPVK